MEKGNPVYFKIEYDNTLKAEKDLLSTEVFFLNLVTLRKKYGLLRMEEIIIKTKISRAIDRMNLAIKKTQNYFPKVNLPKKRKIAEQQINIKSKTDENLDNQLREIQEKLKELNTA